MYNFIHYCLTKKYHYYLMKSNKNRNTFSKKKSKKVKFSNKKNNITRKRKYGRKTKNKKNTQKYKKGGMRGSKLPRDFITRGLKNRAFSVNRPSSSVNRPSSSVNFNTFNYKGLGKDVMPNAIGKNVMPSASVSEKKVYDSIFPEVSKLLRQSEQHTHWGTMEPYPIIPENIINIIGKDSKTHKILKFALKWSDYLSGSSDQRSDMKKHIDNLIYGTNKKEEDEDEDEENFRSRSILPDTTTAIPKSSLYGIYDNLYILRILEFTSNETYDGLGKLLGITVLDDNEKHEDVIMKTIKTVLDKIIGALDSIDCNNILSELSERVLHNYNDTPLTIQNNQICNRLKKKFIKDFSENGYYNRNFLTFANEHKEDLSKLIENLTYTLLLGYYETKKEETKDSIRVSIITIQEEAEKVMEEAKKVIDEGFSKYTYRVANEYLNNFRQKLNPSPTMIVEQEKDFYRSLDKYFDDYYITTDMTPDMKNQDNETNDKEKKEQEFLTYSNNTYEDTHISLTKISDVPTIYSSIIFLLRQWDQQLQTEILKEDYKNLSSKAKESVRYLTLLSCVDLRIGAIIDFICFLHKNEKGICDKNNIEALKQEHFRENGNTLLKISLTIFKEHKKDVRKTLINMDNFITDETINNSVDAINVTYDMIKVNNIKEELLISDN